MPNTYTWIIQKLVEHSPESGNEKIVHSVEWTLKGEDAAGNTVDLPGVTAIPYDETADFTEYSSLTELQIISWIETNTDAESLEIHRKNIDNQLLGAAARLSQTKLPWET
jgi:hypothetical protein